MIKLIVNILIVFCLLLYLKGCTPGKIYSNNSLKNEDVSIGAILQIENNILVDNPVDSITHDSTEDNFIISENEIIMYRGQEKELKIPAKINNISVTSIGNYAFSNIGLKNIYTLIAFKMN